MKKFIFRTAVPNSKGDPPAVQTEMEVKAESLEEARGRLSALVLQEKWFWEDEDEEENILVRTIWNSDALDELDVEVIDQ